MRAIIQRVLNAELKIDGKVICSIQKGLLVYLGFCPEDNENKVDYVLDRIAKIRIFEDENGKINLDLAAVKGEVMLVPNFTLYADAAHGRRPSFSGAAAGEFATHLFDYSTKTFREKFLPAAAGVFGADMKISSVADGPVNVIIEN